jgi:pantoate--beta-alanine ligase
MKVIETITEMKRVRRELNGTVGLVPTMGYLHEGHLELVRRAKAENPWAVVSIFVNPTQFGPREDFAAYPRDIPRDLAMLETVKTDFVFIPPVPEMYPPRFSTWVDLEKVTERLEGATRPGHFRGVATVCAKLFNIVQPTKAYFGQKDAQQCVVIKKMVADLNMNLEIVIVPTVREPDGLAMSSRNTYLKPDERKAAVVLYQALNLARQLWSQGEKDAEKIRRAMIDHIKKQPLANIDYVSIADAETLEELKVVKPPAVVSLAVKIGRPRLLDNIILEG